MSAMAVGWSVFACLCGGALLGMFLRAVLPEHHLSADSKDLMKLGMGLVATMSALVLGLLIAYSFVWGGLELTVGLHLRSRARELRTSS